MGSIAQNEAVTTANPLLFFPFQIEGKLFDVTSLKRSVFEIPLTGAPVQRVAESALDLVATKIDTGVYHADFVAASGAGFVPGTHEVRWKYVFELGGPEIEVRQRFEVLDPAYFYTGRVYVGYASSVDLKRETLFAAQTVGNLQKVIDEASRQIEQWTGRFFEPRYQVYKIDGKNTRNLLLSQPIIGISKVAIESGVNGVNMEISEIEVDGLRMYARHLGGLYDPDDRDSPRIEIERFEGLLFESLQFFPESPQGIQITGVFGYVDANGSPFGQTPSKLMQAIGHMLVPRLTDTFGLSVSTTNPSSIRSARTRDQSVTYGSGGGSTSSRSGGSSGKAAIGGLTGDDFLDLILIPYVRPIHLAAV